MAAFATSILKTTPLLMSVNAAAECRARNDRQSYFTISRALAHAQFELADAELTRRYWQDARGERGHHAPRVATNTQSSDRCLLSISADAQSLQISG